jgi:regulator of protease activity HflC (stomatin/prohibitin superfamily)
MKKTQIGLSVLVFIAILAGVVIVPSLHMVRTEEAAVVRVWGEVDRIAPPGLNFVFWVPNQVERFDLAVREQSFSFSAYSIDAQNVRGYVTVLYQIESPAAAMEIARTFVSMQNLESSIAGVFLQEIQNVFALKSAMEIVEQRAVLSHEIHQRLNDAVENRFHVNVAMVAVGNIEFSIAFEQAVEERMISEQAIIRAEAEAERALIIANQQLEVARLESMAVVVAAQADADALAIMQDAWGDLGTEVREIMLRQLMITSWDGVMPRVIGGSGGEMQFIIDGMGIID